MSQARCVVQPDPAELERRCDDALPRRPELVDHAELDVRTLVTPDEIPELYELEPEDVHLQKQL